MNHEDAGTTCGDPTQNDCTDPDVCDGDGACDRRNQECAMVTSSSLCPLPNLGACGAAATGDGQFRLVFTPDVQVWPGYKLNGSNPGQYYYNAIVDCQNVLGCDIQVNIPYPFVTQGAMPVHIYPDPDFSRGCFVPSGAGVVRDIRIGIADWITPPAQGPVQCNNPVRGPNLLPDFPGSIDARCSFTVHVPGTGHSYINVHLDYGLKGVAINANPYDLLVDRYDAVVSGTSTDGYVDVNNTTSVPTIVALNDCTSYEFWHSGTSNQSDTVQSVNAFKKISGVYSQALRSLNGRQGIAGVTGTLKKAGSSTVVAAGAGDEDGYVLLNYKHTGKAATFVVTLNIPGVGTKTKEVTLKANGWAEASYDADTGTWYVDVK